MKNQYMKPMIRMSNKMSNGLNNNKGMVVLVPVSIVSKVMIVVPIVEMTK